MNEIKKTTAYDWPTRIFHWLFAVFFLTAFTIAKTIDDDSALFSYHMLAGLTLFFLLFLRLIWGFLGTTYAKFSSFQFKPSKLIQYFKEVIFTKTKRYIGHNPASSFAAILMFICTIGLATTGILMASGYETDLIEESHELLANLFIITVILHVGGVLFHHIKHKDSLWSSMFDGKKDSIKGVKGIRNTKASLGILLLILTFSWMGFLINQYNTESQKLILFGIELTLGEDHSSNSSYENYNEEDDDD